MENSGHIVLDSEELKDEGATVQEVCDSVTTAVWGTIEDSEDVWEDSGATKGSECVCKVSVATEDSPEVWENSNSNEYFEDV